MNQPKIVFENLNFLILDKPSGWVVNTALTVKTTYVIQEWLKKKYNFSISKDDNFRSGIVHRLDKETSGLLAVAKNEGTFLALQNEFKERKVKKEYLTLLHGKVEPKKGSIDASVGRLPWNRERFGVLSSGRSAKTDYQVISYYQGKDEKEVYSLVNVKPKTGRTHQIRIHFKYLNHPVVGDIFYAGRKTARKDRKWCPRLFLHAHKLEFTLDRAYSFVSNMPHELDSSLSSLKKV